VLLVNLLAALNFASVFLKKKKVPKIENVKKRKNVTKIKKTLKAFLHLCAERPHVVFTLYGHLCR